MFHKLKQFKDLRDQAKKMEKKMSAEIVNVDENGVKVRMDGTQAMLAIDISEELLSKDKKEKLEQAVLKTVESARKKIQRKMAEQMIKDGGLENLHLPKFS